MPAKFRGGSVWNIPDLHSRSAQWPGEYFPLYQYTKLYYQSYLQVKKKGMFHLPSIYIEQILNKVTDWQTVTDHTSSLQVKMGYRHVNVHSMQQTIYRSNDPTYQSCWEVGPAIQILHFRKVLKPLCILFSCIMWYICLLKFMIWGRVFFFFFLPLSAKRSQPSQSACLSHQ